MRGASTTYGPSTSATRFCQNGERAQPVEADRAEHDGDERQHARRPLRAGEPGERHPENEPPLVLAERGDPREQPEVDGEAVAVVVPGPAAEGGHPEPHHVAVERDGQG